MQFLFSALHYPLSTLHSPLSTILPLSENDFLRDRGCPAVFKADGHVVHAGGECAFGKDEGGLVEVVFMGEEDSCWIPTENMVDCGEALARFRSLKL